MARRKWGAKRFVGIRLEPSLIKSLEEQAQKRGRTVSELARYILRAGIISLNNIEGDRLSTKEGENILLNVKQNNINPYNIMWIDNVKQNNTRKFSLNIKEDIFEVLSKISAEHDVPISIIINTALHIFVQNYAGENILLNKTEKCLTEEYRNEQANCNLCGTTIPKAKLLKARFGNRIIHLCYDCFIKNKQHITLIAS